MKILVLGASGFIGNEIYKNLGEKHEVYGTYFSQSEKYITDNKMIKLDVSVPGDICNVLEKTKPEIVISSLRGDFKDQIKVHKKVIEYIKSVDNGKYVFLSSVNVFDGMDKVPHYENDELNSKSDYGKFKIECEKIMEDELKEKSVILRLPFVWGKRSPRLINLLGQVEKENKINIWSNLYTNNTSDKQIINYIKIILKNNMSGIFHIGTTEIIEYKDFVLKILAASGVKTPQIVEECFDEKCYMAVLSKRKDFTKDLEMTNDDLINEMI